MFRTGDLARWTGIYRCLDGGETSYCEVGQRLPTCGCGGYNEKWEFYAQDQIPDDKGVEVFIKSPLWPSVTFLEVPKVGDILNLSDESNLTPLKGRYRVKIVREIRWGNMPYKQIEVERIGEIDLNSPLNVAIPRGC